MKALLITLGIFFSGLLGLSAITPIQNSKEPAQEPVLGATYFMPNQGGTGTSTIPTYGKVLLGNNNGRYDVVSTSSLGFTQDLSGYLLTSNFGTPFYQYFSATTTDALAQGSVNKYWSNTLFDNRLSASSSISGIQTLPNLSITKSQVSDFGGPYGALSGTNVWTGTNSYTQTINGTNATLSGNVTSTSGVIGNIRIPEVYDSIKDPTGFPDFTTSVITFTSSTRTFTIAPVSGSYIYYIQGVKYTTSTPASLVIPTTAGQLNYLYIDSATNVLTQSSTVWDFWDVQIATVYWNGTNGLIGFDRHGISMDWATHQYLHNTVGTRYESGLTGTFNNANTFALTAGTIDDEGNIDNVSATTTARLFYRTPASGFTFDAVGTTYFKKTCNATHLCYDLNGVLTESGNNAYVNYWVFGTNDRNTFTYVLVGQQTHTTLALARAETPDTLSLGTLPFPEMKLLYKVTLRDAGTTYIEAVDYRKNTAGVGSAFVATSHASLTGLDYASSGHTGFAGTGVDNIFTALNAFSNASTTLLTLLGKTYDSNNSPGAWGEVLSSTGTGVDYVATSTLGLVFRNDWTSIDNYPSACSSGEFVSAIGDTLTCSVPAGGTGTNDWSFDTNYGTSVLTPSTTIPVWFKDNVFTSGTLYLSDKIKINNQQVVYLPNQTTFAGSLIVGNGGNNLVHVTGNDGRFNTLLGIDSGFAMTTGTQNVGIGYHSLYANEGGFSNVAIGPYALNSNIGGVGNMAIGNAALSSNTSGDGNMAVGSSAGGYNVNGSNNVFFGRSAGAGAAPYYNANENVLVGWDAGFSITDNSSRNVMIGKFAGFNETGSDKLYISNSDTVNPLIYGEFNNSLLRINGSLQVANAGDFKFNVDTSGNVSASGTLDVYDRVSFWSNIGTRLLDIVNTGTATLRGVWDYTLAVLKIPNSATAYTNSAGEIAIDTSTNQLRYFGTSTSTLINYQDATFTFSSSTWTTTTTIALGIAIEAQTWPSVYCFTDTGTANVSFYDGTNRMNLFNASTTVGTVSLSTNNTFTAKEKRYVDLGTPAGSATYISCTVQRSVDPN